jgi:hypothetical protein
LEGRSLHWGYFCIKQVKIRQNMSKIGQKEELASCSEHQKLVKMRSKFVEVFGRRFQEVEIDPMLR